MVLVVAVLAAAAASAVVQQRKSLASMFDDDDDDDDDDDYGFGSSADTTQPAPQPFAQRQSILRQPNAPTATQNGVIARPNQGVQQQPQLQPSQQQQPQQQPSLLWQW